VIVEWIMGLGSGISGWIASLFPTDFEVPPFLANLDTMINDLLEGLTGIGAWVDWVFIIATVSVVIGVWLLAFGVKIIRAIVAHAPFVGGAG